MVLRCLNIVYIIAERDSKLAHKLELLIRNKLDNFKFVFLVK